MFFTMKYDMKPLFRQRMESLLTNKADFEAFERIVHIGPRNFIRCNTLKIQPDELFRRLSLKWDVEQLSQTNPEIILIKTELKPGELGNAIEHLLGYYYVQELSSMLSVIALDPQPNETILDLCAAPGSKTSQIAAKMQNQGNLFANDVKIDRIKILSSTLEKTGVTNAIVTRNDGVNLCQKLSKRRFKFDKILLDAPCSGEGTLRSSPKTFLMWNHKVVESLSRLQKKLIANAINCLKVNGTLVYSTCTHAPEENEHVVNFLLNNFPVRLESINLPVKSRPGIIEWNGEKFSKEIHKCIRIYPQDNDSEGFFVAKFTLLEEIKEERKI